MIDNEKILLGSSLPLLEVEEDDDGDMEDNASLQYDLLNCLDSIESEEFKEHYNIVINKIRNETIENQRVFCTKILDKIEEIYNYIPPLKHSLNDQYQINEVYNLIRFLDSPIIFLSNLWTHFNIDLRKIDVEQFCNEHINEFCLLIDEKIKENNYPLMITEYLRTNKKVDMIKFIIEKTNKSKMLVELEVQILKGEI
jgi:hypothetical protein